jgi:hypothetical protein
LFLIVAAGVVLLAQAAIAAREAIHQEKLPAE